MRLWETLKLAETGHLFDERWKEKKRKKMGKTYSWNDITSHYMANINKHNTISPFNTDNVLQNLRAEGCRVKEREKTPKPSEERTVGVRRPPFSLLTLFQLCIAPSPSLLHFRGSKWCNSAVQVCNSHQQSLQCFSRWQCRPSHLKGSGSSCQRKRSRKPSLNVYIM